MTQQPSSCRACKRWSGAASVGLEGNGPTPCDVLVVVPWPNNHDDRNGQLLHPSHQATAILRAICQHLTDSGLAVRFEALLRCCNTSDKDGYQAFVKPGAAELQTCRKTWYNPIQAELIQQGCRVVVLLGAEVVKSVLGYRTAPIAELRLNPQWVDEVAYVCTYSPVMMMDLTALGQREAYAKLGFQQVRDAVTEDMVRAGEIAHAVLAGTALTAMPHKRADLNWRVVESAGEAMQVLRWAADAGRHACDIESNGYEDTAIEDCFNTDYRIVCVGVNFGTDCSYIIPLETEGWPTYQGTFRPDWHWCVAFMEALLALSRTGKQFWFAGGTDLIAIHVRFGLSPYIIWWDPIGFHHTLRSNELPHSLSNIMSKLTPHWSGHDTEMNQAMAAIKSPKDRAYTKTDSAILIRKNAYDTAGTLTIGELLYAELEQSPEWVAIYWEEFLPSTWASMEMTINGLAVNETVRRELDIHLTAKRSRIEQLLWQHPSWQAVERLHGKVLNPGSSKDLVELLFRQEKLPVLAYTKGSRKKPDHEKVPATDKKVKAALAEQNDLAYGLLKIGALISLQDKMVQKVPNWMNNRDGFVHGTFRIHGTLTGRWASAKPNTQNFPRGGDPEDGMPDIPVMYMFQARPGYLYLYLDVSQAEYRTAAHVTQEPALLECFHKGLDYHATIGSELFGVPYEEVKTNDTIRGPIKRFNFGLFYGLTPHGLAAQANITKERAEEIFRLFFERLTLVEENLFQPVHQAIMQLGYVGNLFGRVWWARDKFNQPYDLSDKYVRARVFRQSVNDVIQSSSSGIVCAGMRDFREERDRRWNPNDVRFCNAIHDSLIVECKADPDLLCQVGQAMTQCYEHPRLPFKLTVPWKIDLKTGTTLGAKSLYSFDPYKGTIKVKADDPILELVG